jgi:F-type H+-transporting ATPase subunit b
MLEFNFTLVIQIINFLVLLFLLNIILYKPIRKIMGQRREEMSTAEKVIADLLDGYSRSSKELEQDMAAARKDGFKEKEDRKNQGRDEESKMVQKAIDTVSEKISKSREDITRNMTGLRQSLDKEISLFSQELAEKVLGRSI